MNPYQDLPLFTQNKIREYNTKDLNTLPPHIYGIAQLAFSSLCREKSNHSVVIAGESGAGRPLKPLIDNFFGFKKTKYKNKNKIKIFR